MATLYGRVGDRNSKATMANATDFWRWLSTPVRRTIVFGAIVVGLTLLAFSARRPAGLNSASGVARTSAADFQYGIMLDAGSTGSRIHVYRFLPPSTPGGLPEPVDEVFEQIKPGLSAYANDPHKAAASLQPLIRRALEAVPASQHRCTPIALRATAGLRLLGAKEADAILSEVRAFLKATPFRLPDSGVTILDGADEGLFAWITVNMLDGRLGQLTKVPTAGIMDLGGGSTQIVFEPKDPAAMDSAPDTNRYQLTIGGHSYLLYLHSHLGYGLMEARKAALQTAAAGRSRVEHPCFPADYSAKVPLGVSNALEVLGVPSGDFATCRSVIKSTLRRDAPCPAAPCSVNGAFQPSASVMSDDLYIFSFFFDRAEELELGEAIKLSHYHDVAQLACDADADLAAWPVVRAVREKNPHLCLDLTFMFSLLNDGYGLAPDRPMKLTKKIRGFETGWCLGAIVHLMNAADIQCLD